MTWLGKSNYQPVIRDDVFERRSPQRPVQRQSDLDGQSGVGTGRGHQAPTGGDLRGTLQPSAKDVSKLRAMIIWRDAPHWLTGEQAAMALGLGAADFERKVAVGELGLVSKTGPGDQRLYQRDAVRGMILAGG